MIENFVMSEGEREWVPEYGFMILKNATIVTDNFELKQLDIKISGICVYSGGAK